MSALPHVPERIGTLLKGIRQYDAPYGGIAVHSQETWFAVADWRNNCVHVYAMNNMVASLHATYSPGGRFQPRGLCFTDCDTLLVCDLRSDRVVECDLDGNHMRQVIILECIPWAVDCTGDMIAVSSSSGNRINIYSYSSGACVRSIRDLHTPNNIHLIHGGARALVVNRNKGTVCELDTTTGDVFRVLASDISFPYDVVACVDDTFFVSTFNFSWLHNASSQFQFTHLGHLPKSNRIVGMHLSGNVYVLEPVWVYSVRAAFVTACVY